MPIPQLIDPDATRAQKCHVAIRWGIRLELADRLASMAARLDFPVQIISGARTFEQQRAQERGAAWALTTHADMDQEGCLRFATGVDVWPLVGVTNAVKARLGAEAVHAGLRWGGGSPTEPVTGIPVDWNHLDLGPRALTG